MTEKLVITIISISLLIFVTKKVVNILRYDKGYIKKIIIIISSITLFIFVNVNIFNLFRYDKRYLTNESMMPTFMKREVFLVDQISYYKTSPKRGEIILFKDLQDHSTHPRCICRRIIGLPGDIVEVKDKIGVFINNKKLNETYSNVARNNICSKKMICGPIKIPSNHYYVLGDKRDLLTDSRQFGVISKEQIKGKVTFKKILPFKSIPIYLLEPINSPQYK
jgi:signal peptidase I